MRSILALSIIFGLLGSINADTCLGKPRNVKIEKFCGGPTSCEYGSFCNTFGICQALRVAGESCVENSQCIFGYDCQGPENAKVCVELASAGSACDDDPETTNPSCGNDNCVNNVCGDGNVGDKCANTASCFGNTTCDTYCKPLINGDFCTSSSECPPTSYCDTTEDICRPKKTEGICSSENQCAYEYACIGVASGDTKQCVEFGSRKTGEYCDEDDRVCSSGNCHYSGYCAKRGVTYCENDGECSYGEVCACNNQPLVEGFGTCAPNGCFGAWEKYNKCVYENCGSAGLPSHLGDCRYVNCQKEAMKYLDCSSASQIVFSFLSLTLIAIFSIFFGKNI